MSQEYEDSYGCASSLLASFPGRAGGWGIPENGLRGLSVGKWWEYQGLTISWSSKFNETAFPRKRSSGYGTRAPAQEEQLRQTSPPKRVIAT